MSASREIAAGVCAGGMTITNGSSCWSESGVRTRMWTVSESSANRSLQRRKRLTSRSVVVSALARVSGAGSLHDAELTSVAMAPWGATRSLRREVPRRRAPCGKPHASGVSLPDRTGWLPYGAFLRLRNPAGALPLRRILRPQYPLRSISAPRSGWARGRLRRGMFRRDRRPCDLACLSLCPHGSAVVRSGPIRSAPYGDTAPQRAVMSPAVRCTVIRLRRCRRCFRCRCYCRFRCLRRADGRCSDGGGCGCCSGRGCCLRGVRRRCRCS